MTNVLEDRPARSRYLTAEEYARMPERSDGMKDELVRGSVVCEPQPSFGHGVASMKIGHLLSGFVERHGLGFVLGEAGYVLERGPDTVRGPDVSFVSTERLRHRGKTFFEGAPDLAVEVISPSNTRRAVAEKTRDYLAAGARLVWNVDPRRETVTVHAPNAEPRVLGADDILDGGEVLPGFSVPVRSLFG
ncbi:MAG TPA: Uma2 family endonuclease [Thermoanaerobaculia bacterium]|nr:Uma2 family endonuclease [Thermoanaerobaculia bacterium]